MRKFKHFLPLFCTNEEINASPLPFVTMWECMHLRIFEHGRGRSSNFRVFENGGRCMKLHISENTGGTKFDF
jgi:hypothetical protein